MLAIGQQHCNEQDIEPRVYAFRRKDGNVYQMALKHWMFPPEAKYMEVFVTAFGPGECDDHWVLEVHKAPAGAAVAGAGDPATTEG